MFRTGYPQIRSGDVRFMGLLWDCYRWKSVEAEIESSYLRQLNRIL